MRWSSLLPACLVCLGLLAPLVEATAQDGVEEWAELEFEELGFGESTQRYHTEPELTFTFSTRGDEVLTDARLELRTAPSPDTRDLSVLRALVVLVNDEEVARLPTLSLQTQSLHEIPVDGRLLSETNRVTLRMETPDEDPCGASVPAGTWRVVEGGTLSTRGKRLPLSADLSILPLPFYDAATDVDVAIPIVLPRVVDHDTLEAAGLVSAWWGLTIGSKVRFPVRRESLPQGSGVVLLVGGGEDLGLSLAAVEKPTISMVDHPSDATGNAKLLVLQAPDAPSLVEGARSLLLSPQEHLGSSLVLDKVELPPALAAYDAPRWMADGRTVAFSDLVDDEALVHKGLQGGTMGLDFRLAPDVFAWPRDLLRVTIDYRQLAPAVESGLVPSLIVELNGAFVQKLPRVIGGNGLGSETVEIHRSQLRGFNRLQFHVSWPESDKACDPILGERVESRILTTSSIHLDNLPHFAVLPNVESFVDDGFPFTRRPDLAETMVVLPDEPSNEELGTFLSIMAHFAAVTGTAPYYVELVGESQLDTATSKSKDLLVIGTSTTLPGADRWYGALPFAVGSGRMRVQEPEVGQQALDLLGGHISALHARDAERHLLRGEDIAAVLGGPSPLAEGRTLVVITAGGQAAMPAAADLIGFTNADRPGGDVLLLTDDRYRYKLGPTFTMGHIGTYTHLRWLLAVHWLVLIPAILVGVALMARAWRIQLSGRERARLAEAGEGDQA